MFFVAILILMITGDILWWAWADARLRRINARWWWRGGLGAFSGALLAYLVFFILFPVQGRNAHAWMPVYPLASVYVWHLFVLPATLLGLLIIGTMVRVRRWAKSSAPVTPEHTAQVPDSASPEMESAQLSRRQLLTAAAVAAPPLLLGGAVGFSVSRLTDFRIRRLDIAFPDLPLDLDGVTIAHITDIHVGRFTRPYMLPKIVDAANSLKADLVAFTGDLIDLALDDLPPAVEMMKRIDPRSGMFIVEGNHDLIEDPIGFETGLRVARLPLLLDDSRTVLLRGHPVQVMGMSWMRTDAAMARSVSELLLQRDPHAFAVLLAHHPHAFDAAAAVGIPLTLSGHTHGGQLMLNERLGIGPAMFRYWTGLYEKGPSKLVVSNGVGNWFPLRINAPAEIIHITLHRA